MSVRKGANRCRGRGAIADGGQKNRQRIGAGCDRKSREADAGNGDVPALVGRQPRGIGCGEIHHQIGDRAGLVGQFLNAKPAHFGQTLQRRGWAHQQMAVAFGDMHAVIGDQPREWQAAALGFIQKAKARRDFPAPDGPRISTASRDPISTAVA